jgi:hypothetical protein
MGTMGLAAAAAMVLIAVTSALSAAMLVIGGKGRRT